MTARFCNGRSRIIPAVLILLFTTRMTHWNSWAMLFSGRMLSSIFIVASPARPRGDASLKSEVVSRRILAGIGQNMELFPFIHVDIANLRTFNERSRDSLCADVLKAIVGAIQIYQGQR